MHYPLTTYRVQLSKDFRFSDLADIKDYLYKLGVTDIYASPIMTSVPGSTHGYDTIDFNEINPEIGTQRELEDVSDQFHELGIGWIQDFVPNHMAYSSLNPYIKDVMIKGEASKYYEFFDIVWNRREDPHPGRICAPFLGVEYSTALHGDHILFTESMELKYFDKTFPLSPESVKEIKELTKNSIDPFVSTAEMLDSLVQTVNGDKNILDKLIQSQYYNLEYWKNARKEINYRRFFVINDLISMSMEREWVFEETHKLILSLVEKGIIDGMRLDHVDGLLNPGGYLMRLEERGQFYRVVEKILVGDEELPMIWDCKGTTGYDFLGAVNQLFTMRESEGDFDMKYGRVGGTRSSFDQMLRATKKEVLERDFPGNMSLVVDSIYEAMTKADSTYTPSDEKIRKFITYFITSLDTYRMYIQWGAVPYKAELTALASFVREIGKVDPALSEFCEKYANLLDSEQYLNRLAGRLQQLSGPVMAKTLEDTLFFRFNRLISLNEVGTYPGTFGYSIQKFHSFMQERSSTWKQTMNSTSTHDTKMGEDGRARLSVLSEMPDKWFRSFWDWNRLNSSHKSRINGEEAPDLNEEYYIYQVMLAGLKFDDGFSEDFAFRVKRQITKAIREAEVHGSWAEGETRYEDAVTQFLDKILDQGTSQEFLEEFRKFWEEISRYGVLNSISQLAIKMTVPGIPDTYQGSELWNFSLTDPDNRSPIDSRYLLEKMNKLEEIGKSKKAIEDLLEDYKTGLIKLHITISLMQLRKKYRAFFLSAEYVPLEVKGDNERHLIAFARKSKDRVVITIAPRFFTSLCRGDGIEFKEGIWSDFEVVSNWNLKSLENVITGEKVEFRKRVAIPVESALGKLPAVVLVGEIQGE